MSFRLVASLALLTAFFALGLKAQTYLLNENFNAGSAGWTITQQGAAGTWGLSTVGPVSNPGTLNGTQHMLVDADATGAPGTLTASTLTSPTFNGTTAPGSLFLTFQQYFELYQAGETGVVQVFNGTTWNTVLTVNATIGGLSAPDAPNIDITAYKNAANQVRFVYQDNTNWGYWWLLDNIQVYYNTGAEIDVQRPAGVANSIATGSRCDVGQAPIGTPTNFIWTVANQGAVALTHTAVIAASPAAVNCTFGTITLPASTAASASSTLTIPVTPTAAGFFTFRISITNNDANENPYIIDVSGIALAGSVLFYGGDADLVDGTVNGRGYATPNDVFIYEDFTVPAGQTWTVTQLFSNNYMSAPIATQADWEIRTGVAAGTGGTLVGSGTGLNVSVSATGRSAFGFNEYNIITHLTTAQVLTAGTYFVGVRPVRVGLVGSVYCSTTSGTNGVGAPLGNDLAFGNQVGTQFAGLAWEQLNDGGTPAVFYDYSIGVRGTSSSGTGPTVTINQAGGQADPTSTSPILFTAVFSAPVTGFATGDVSFTGSTAGGTLVGTVSGGPSTYTITVTGMTTSGTVVATIAASVCTATTGGQANQASTSTDNSVTWNAAATGPTVTINQGATQADPTSTSPIIFDVVFSAAVTGFATGDVTFSGTAGGTLVGTVSGGPTSYTVTVTGMTTSGTVIASIAASVCTATTGGQANQASTSTDNTVTWNAAVAGPTVTINQGGTQADPTSTAPIIFTAVFSASVTGFATGDVTLSGTAGGTLVGTVSGGPTTYTVTVTGMTTTGTVIANIGGGVCTATTGGQANQASTSTDNSVTWNAAAGALTITTTTLPNGTVGSAYNATITSTGGTAPFAWSLQSGTLPPGLSLNTASVAATTTLSGTPTTAGTYNFVVLVSDGAAGADTQSYSVTVSTGGGTIGKGSGGGGGCSTDGTQAPWFAVFGVLAALVAFGRLRRARQ